MNFIRLYYILLIIFLSLWAQGGHSTNIKPCQTIPFVVPIKGPTTFNQQPLQHILAPNSSFILLSERGSFHLFEGASWRRFKTYGIPSSFEINETEVLYSTGKEIFLLKKIQTGHIETHLMVDSSFLPRGEFFQHLSTFDKSVFFIASSNKIWKYLSGAGVLIDSSEFHMQFFAGNNELFYSKPNAGLFEIDKSTFKTNLILSNKNATFGELKYIFWDEKSTVAITEEFPWFWRIKSNTLFPINDASATFVKGTKILKVKRKKNLLWVMTDHEGIVSISLDLKPAGFKLPSKSVGNFDIIDFYPVSGDEIIATDGLQVNHFFGTNIRGKISAVNGVPLFPTLLLEQNNVLYCATSSGVYTLEAKGLYPENLCLKKTIGIDGPVSFLQEHKGSVVAAGHSGAFLINNEKASPLSESKYSNQNSVFTIIQWQDNSWLAASKQSSIWCYPISKNESSFSLPLPKGFGHVTEMVFDNGILYLRSELGFWSKTNPFANRIEWVTSSSFEVERIKPESWYTNFISTSGDTFEQSGLPREKVTSTLLFANERTALFSKEIDKIPGKSIWIVRRNIGEAPSPTPVAFFPSPSGPMSAAIFNDYILVSVGNELYYFKTESIAKQKPTPNPTISLVTAGGPEKIDTLINGWNLIQNNFSINLPAPYNRNLNIFFASAQSNEWGGGQCNVQYSTFISGVDSSWSTWSNNSFKSLTIPRNGEYIFKVKSRNAYGAVSNEAQFSFFVKPFVFQNWYFIGAFLLLGVVTMIMLFNWRRYLHAKERYMLESIINQRTEELVREKEKTDNLLARVLPSGTASELKEKGKVNTQRYQMVTVLFSDIEGFTRITDETNPENLIDQLDKFFLYFDSVVDHYRIEKIKTIGDAYMCAGGIPKKNRTNPIEVVLAALEMMQYMKHITTSGKNQKNIWDLRIGIDTGPVIAGVVGRNKLSYDIWGSTVNTASRMESSGEVGQINISENTYMFVKDYFDCTFRGKMPVKNKGDIQMYFVNGIRPSLSNNLEGIIPNYEFNIQLQIIRLGDLEDYMFEKLQTGLPKNLYYHNMKHTVDVYTQVELIGRSENLTLEEILLLRTAALFHDAGHMIDYSTHEEMSVKLVKEILPEYQYTREQIEVISQLIMVTKLPPKPTNLLEEIICDADLDYLGRPDFLPVSNNLYQELHEHGKIGTLREWNELQIKFIEGHHYFTNTARRLRNVNKNSQLAKIKAWLEKN
jgi:class 3 adenylate cyclase